MNETAVRQTSQPASDNRARRTQRGIVAGYIHELSRRHESGHVAQATPRPASEATEGG
jgi:hypothetical protein